MEGREPRRTSDLVAEAGIAVEVARRPKRRSSRSVAAPRVGFGGRIEESEGRALSPLLVTGPKVVRRRGAIELRGIARGKCLDKR